MSRTPSIAVLGCGYWGQNHARTLADLGALSAVSDKHPERAAETSEKYNVRALDPEELMLDPSLDGVVIALPPHFHADFATTIINSGKNVLVEKPIALNPEDAERVVEAADNKGVIAMTGHVLRFHPAFEKLEELVKTGTLGKINYIHSHRVGLGKFHAENDALWDIAPHDLSLIMALTGEAPSKIHGEGAAMVDHLSDFAHLHLEFPSGIRSHVFTSRLNPYRERKLTVIGDKAMAVFDDVAPWDQKLALYHHKLWRDEKGWHGEMADPDYVAIPDGMPLTRECAHFIECIQTGAKPRTPVSDGLDVIRILAKGTIQHPRPEDQDVGNAL